MQMHSPYASFGIDDPIACRLAKRIEAEPSPKHPGIARRVTELRDQCEITQLSRELTRTSFENIAALHALPEKLYAFEVFHDGNWETVGLYESEGLCREVREEASSRGVGTKMCSKWAPRF